MIMRLFDWNKHSFTILHIPSIFINKNQLQRPRWLLFRKDDLKCTLCWHKHKHHSLGNEYQNRLITDPMLLANFGIFLKETSTYRILSFPRNLEINAHCTVCCCCCRCYYWWNQKQLVSFDINYISMEFETRKKAILETNSMRINIVTFCVRVW